MKLMLFFSLATLFSFYMPDTRYHWTDSRFTSNQESPETKPLFSFGIISDVQYADINPLGTRYFRSSADKLEDAVKTFRKDSVNFIVNLGDLIDKDYESYKPMLNILNSSGIKTYHLTGNHDYSVDPRYLTRLPVLTESREGYYSIIYRKYRLIFLNGNEISTYVSANKTLIRQANEYIAKLKKNGAINAIDWNGGIGPDQTAWITSQLDQAADNSEKVVFFCHFPIAPENIHNLLNYKEINDILKKYTNIIAWFSGHNHEGNYCTINNIHFVTFKGMVETKRENSFAIIDVYNDKISVKGYGRENSVLITL
jgi:manganese-dependent ADP-ribose/CDP-alcohol diphosphatase